MAQLGVNIDHVATVREARKTNEPDPVWAASLAELAGADGITIHLREDRRHIQDRDLRLLRDTVAVKLNLELACAEEIIAIACQVTPDQATLVPEKREEVTTEGGLDVVTNFQSVQRSVKRLQDAGMTVSLFIDPDVKQIAAAKETGATAIELHTGSYALAIDATTIAEELEKLKIAGNAATDCGLTLHAGHGLTYRNVCPVAQLSNMCELNIGHSIIARAIMVGMDQAIRDMKRLIS